MQKTNGFKSTFCCCLALVVTSCSSVPRLPPGVLTPAQLNVARVQYDGQKVTVQGWMRSEFENYVLWESKGANEEGSFSRNCVSLRIPVSMDTDRFNRRYVVIVGEFMKSPPKDIVQMGGCYITSLKVIEVTAAGE